MRLTAEELDFILHYDIEHRLGPTPKSRLNGDELIFSGPTNVVRFTQQSTLNLTPPVTWIDSTQSPAVIGAQFTVTSALSGSAQFYRSRKL